MIRIGYCGFGCGIWRECCRVEIERGSSDGLRSSVCFEDRVAVHASQMFSANIFNFIEHFWSEEQKTINCDSDSLRMRYHSWRSDRTREI